ncbi:MAG: esterase-like activity of phytase family protein [Pseudonocardiales bacterium]|nr:esterase-like activity of phytase family protein [Pseudonocardiales bacterium]
MLAAAAGCASKPTSSEPPCATAPQASVASPSAVAAPGAPITVVSDATLPRIPLADFQHRALPADGALDDHGIVLGGIGSDIYPAQAPDEYWMVTDRGPNGKAKTSGGKVRTFPVPGFDPSILRVKVAGNRLDVQQTIPITTTAGRPVTGLSNSATDEPPYDLRGQQPLPLNPAGLDTEGMVRAPNGDFWLSEEYSPSIVHVSPTGTVLARYVPQGTALPDPGYPVFATLPAILAKRKLNRGLESMAISPDGGTLYTTLQSPLAWPDEGAGDVSLALRLFAVNAQTGQAGAEYVYPLEEARTFDPATRGDQAEMKVSALAWYGPGQLLVEERTDDVAKLYVARIDPARNILGGPFDDVAHSPSLEQAGPTAVTALTKTPLVDLTGLVSGLPKKIEGIAVRDQKTIAIANDNDFAMPTKGVSFGPDDRLCDSGDASRLLVLHLN